jgi:hypothetical protein
LSYIQEKDYLTIFYPSQEEFTIRISYKGKNNKFYSNAKQTLLPGWFAWYPMAGSHAVFLTYKDYGLMYGYNPYNRIDTAEVTITSDIPLVSNLTQLDSNTYSGYTDGITILSGNFAETGNTVVPYCLPLLLEKTKTTEIFAKELQEQYHSVLKTLKTVYGVDTSVLENKKILIASSDLSKNMTNNDIAIFNDYILTTPYGITEDNIMKYLILQDRKLTEERTNSFEMQQLLFSMNFSGDAQMDYDSINELLCEQKNEPLYTFIQEQEPHEFVKKIVSFMLGTSQYNFTDFQKETDAK